MNGTLLESIAYVRAALEQEGIVVPDNSRIGRLHRLLREHDGDTILPSHPDFPAALEGVREIQQLAFILDYIKRPGVPPDIQPRLRRLLKDNLLLQDDSQSTPGRDTQCELYTYAICAKAGLKPTFEEPDLRIVLNGERFGIAVKRIKSLEKLESRLREAANQIRKAEMPGFIIADVMTAFNPENRPVPQPCSDRTLRDQWRRMFRRFVDERNARFKEWTRHKWVRGIVFLDHALCLSPEEAWGLHSMSYSVCLVDCNARRSREFQEFWAGFHRGLATPPNECSNV